MKAFWYTNTNLYFIDFYQETTTFKTDRGDRKYNQVIFIQIKKNYNRKFDIIKEKHSEPNCTILFLKEKD